MNKEQMELMDRGFKQGFCQGFGEAMKIAIKLIETASNNRILPPDKTFLSADLKLQAKILLQKKGYMPYDYDVITGNAEIVKAPWEE